MNIESAITIFLAVNSAFIIGLMVADSRPEFAKGFLSGFTLGLWDRE